MESAYQRSHIARDCKLYRPNKAMLHLPRFRLESWNDNF